MIEILTNCLCLKLFKGALSGGELVAMADVFSRGGLEPM
jgi:hypothetical protein